VTDADVETLRRAMVEAHATWSTLNALGRSDAVLDAEACIVADEVVDAARAYVAARRARREPREVVPLTIWPG
jgi:hypothetical protein